MTNATAKTLASMPCVETLVGVVLMHDVTLSTTDPSALVYPDFIRILLQKWRVTSSVANLTVNVEKRMPVAMGTVHPSAA